MKILKKRFPGSVINPSAKGLIARALHDQARADQQATGKDYSSAWYDLVDRLATDQTVEINAEQEGDLRSWIYSLPLEALKKNTL